MKLSFSTLGCPDWPFEKVLKEAKRMQFDAIEIRGIEGDMEAMLMPCLMPGHQQSTKRMLDQYGLKICCFDASINFHNISQTAQTLENGKQTIDICENMGIPYIRVFGDRIPQGMTADGATGLVAEGVNALCDYAQNTNVRILLEVHGDFNTIEIMKSLFKKVNHDRFGILWDIEHSDIVYGKDFLPFYETIKPYLYHVHIKDHKRQPNGEFQLCSVGDGDIPIKEIRDVLLKDGYTGYLSLEWEKRWHPELPNCETEFPHFRQFMEH